MMIVVWSIFIDPEHSLLYDIIGNKKISSAPLIRGEMMLSLTACVHLRSTDSTNSTYGGLLGDLGEEGNSPKHAYRTKNQSENRE
jgi:hypothetical protein